MSIDIFKHKCYHIHVAAIGAASTEEHSVGEIDLTDVKSAPTITPLPALTGANENLVGSHTMAYAMEIPTTAAQPTRCTVTGTWTTLPHNGKPYFKPEGVLVKAEGPKYMLQFHSLGRLLVTAGQLINEFAAPPEL